MTISTYISLGALAISAIGLIAQYFGFIAKLDKRVSNLEDKAKSLDLIPAIDKRLGSLEVKMEPFWKMVEENLPHILMQPIHLRKDELLQKMMSGMLTLCEAQELKDILKKELKDTSRKDFWVAIVLVLSQLEATINHLEYGRGK